WCRELVWPRWREHRHDLLRRKDLRRNVNGRHRAHGGHHSSCRCKGNWLRWPGLLAGPTCLGRHRHFADGIDGLTGLPVQDIEEAILARLGERFHTLPPHLHVEEYWLVPRVVVPHVVVRLLKEPLQPAGVECERENRIGEQVHTGSLRAVAERIADCYEKQAELGVD